MAGFFINTRSLIILFTGYQKGAFYPTHYFDRVINGLVNTIESCDGGVLLEREVTEFILANQTVTGVRAKNLKTNQSEEYSEKTIVCNIDPETSARSSGMEKFFVNSEERAKL